MVAAFIAYYFKTMAIITNTDIAEDLEATGAASGGSSEEQQLQIPGELPLLPLRDIVIYPFMIVPLFVSREKSIRAVDEALGENRMILLASQKDLDKEEPTGEDLYGIGTVAVIMRMLKLPDGRIRILVQGLARAQVESVEASWRIPARAPARHTGDARARTFAGSRSVDPQRARLDGEGRQPGQKHLARSDGDHR